MKALTGHKTLSQLERYVNVQADDLVALMHGKAPAQQPASPAVPQAEAVVAPRQEAPTLLAATAVEEREIGSNVVRIDFRRRCAA